MVSQITTRPSGLLQNAPGGRVAHLHGHFSWASRQDQAGSILAEETALRVREGEEGQAAGEVEEAARPDRGRLRHPAEQAVGRAGLA